MMPKHVKYAWQSYVQTIIYPTLMKLNNSDYMHDNFILAADHGFLPSSGKLETENVDLRVLETLKYRGVAFPTPIGIGSGLLINGSGIDNIFSASGIDSASGLSTFLEIGTCTPEKQSLRQGMSLKRIEIDLRHEKVKRVNSNFTPCVAQVISNLIER